MRRSSVAARGRSARARRHSRRRRRRVGHGLAAKPLDGEVEHGLDAVEGRGRGLGSVSSRAPRSARSSARARARCRRDRRRSRRRLRSLIMPRISSADMPTSWSGAKAHSGRVRRRRSCCSASALAAPLQLVNPPHQESRVSDDVHSIPLRPSFVPRAAAPRPRVGQNHSVSKMPTASKLTECQYSTKHYFSFLFNKR